MNLPGYGTDLMLRRTRELYMNVSMSNNPRKYKCCHSPVAALVSGNSIHNYNAILESDTYMSIHNYNAIFIACVTAFTITCNTGKYNAKVDRYMPRPLYKL